MLGALPCDRILIIGATARAAAESAAKAGLTVTAIDRFGDQDLQRVAKQWLVCGIPDQVVEASSSFAPMPWMYTGPLENHPSLVEMVGRDRPLLGNSGAVIRAVRDPLRLCSLWESAGLRAPEVSVTRPAGMQKPWLTKRSRSSGGSGIRVLSANTPIAVKGHYFQEFVPGPTVSGAYVAARGRATLLGVTLQLTGEVWCGAKGFQYCGSIGPAKLSERETQDLEVVGNVLASTFGLKGLLGVDAVLSDGRAWPVDINPRYSASVEVVEQWRGPLIENHLRACLQGILPLVSEASPRDYYGKAIVFANRSGSFVQPPVVSDAIVSDIPQGNTQFQVGDPILTVRVAAGSAAAVRRRLQACVAEVRSQLSC